MSAEPWFVTVRMPTIFPSGPDGWMTFWTDATIVRWVSSTRVTVIRSRVGEAIAVSNRRTERMGSGARCFFLPHGARRKRVAMGSSPRNPNRGATETNPIGRDQSPDRGSAHLTIPAKLACDGSKSSNRNARKGEVGSEESQVQIGQDED